MTDFKDYVVYLFNSNDPSVRFCPSPNNCHSSKSIRANKSLIIFISFAFICNFFMFNENRSIDGINSIFLVKKVFLKKTYYTSRFFEKTNVYCVYSTCTISMSRHKCCFQWDQLIDNLYTI